MGATAGALTSSANRRHSLLVYSASAVQLDFPKKFFGQGEYQMKRFASFAFLIAAFSAVTAIAADDIKLVDYKHHPSIKAKMIV